MRHVGCRLGDRQIAGRPRGLRGARRDRRKRVGTGSGGRLDLRGDNQASQARDRQAAAGAIRPQLGTPCPPARPDGVAARGTRGRRHRGRDRCGEDDKDNPGRRLRPSPPGPQAVPGTPATGPGGDRSPLGLLLLWLRPHREDGGGYHRDAGGDPATVEGGPDGPGEVHLPHLREDLAAPGAVPCHAARMGGSEPAGHGPVREVRTAPAAQQAG